MFSHKQGLVDRSDPLSSLQGRTGGSALRVLLVASSGGHLTELKRLSRGWNIDPGSLWVTFDTPQSRSLLASSNAAYVPYVRPRDVRGVLRTAVFAHGLFASEHFDAVVSTGAAVACGVLPISALRRTPTIYIESIARMRRPSMTARTLSLFPVALYHQSGSWQGPRWHESASVLEQFAARQVRPAKDPGRLFVTLGTIRPYRFDALIDAVLNTGLANENTVWQVGETTRSRLPGTVVSTLSESEFHQHAAAADVVITHAGVGTLLDLLELGVHPVLVPRRQKRREHVDDHQLELSHKAALAGIAVTVEAPDLRASHLRRAASMANVELGRP